MKGTGSLSKKINVLHIVQHATGGGVINQLFNLLRAYDRDSFNPLVCCLGGKGLTGDLIEKSGIEFVSMHFKNNDRLIMSAVIRLRRLMMDKQIHVVRTHGYGANLNGRIASLLCRIPCVSSIHNVYTKEKKIQRRIANYLLGLFPCRIVAVSEAVRSDVLRYDHVDPSKVMVIRNGVDADHFSPGISATGLRRELGISEDDIVIGFVGRLVQAKGLSYLIEAFADIKKNLAHVKLLIVGRGMSMNALNALAREMGIQDHVLFIGERRDIAHILLSMDIFVMPSEKEGLPNALLEAMAAAKPVLVTTAGGMREVVVNGVTGLVVPVADSAALSLGMKRLLEDNDSARAMGRAARAHIEKNLSIRATAHIWEDLYREMLKKKGGVAKAAWPGERGNAE